MDRPEFQPLAEIEVDEVKPERQGFTMPLDPRTRTVLGELLSHSGLTISRRASTALAAPLRTRRDRAHQP